MTHGLSDPDVGALAGLSRELQGDYKTDVDPWTGSPFAWIKSQQSRRRGKIGEQLVSGLLALRDFDVVRSPDSEADRVINGMRVEIKFSTLWDSKIYKFQQVRDQNYVVMFCLGVSPFNAHAWAVPKVALLEHAIGHLGQHGGAGGRDTAWLSFPPDNPYPWISPYGGRLRDAIQVLRRLVNA